MKKAVLTGATGAIGTALIQKLIEEDVFVYVLCRPDSPRKSRIPAHKNVRVVDCGLGQIESLESFDNRCDVFYHLGWEGTFGGSRDDVYMQNRNVTYALDAVALAGRLGCSVFVGAGSQAEYGRVDGILGPKTPVFPETGYGIAKLCAGQLTRLLCTQSGIRHIWTRILSVYGPGDGMGTMVTSTISKLLNKEETSFTEGEQQWDYLYSADAADALFLMGEKGQDGAVYCLGSGSTRPLKEYILALGNAVAPDVPLGLGKIPYHDKQVMTLCADITELQKDTDFSPKVGFEEGILKTVDWYKKEWKI